MMPGSMSTRCCRPLPPPAECLLRTSYMATLTEPLIDEAVEIIGSVLGEKV